MTTFRRLRSRTHGGEEPYKKEKDTVKVQGLGYLLDFYRRLLFILKDKVEVLHLRLCTVYTVVPPVIPSQYREKDWI